MWVRAAGPFDEVPAVGVVLIRHVVLDPGPRRFGIVGDDDVELTGHTGARGVVPSLLQPFPVRLEEITVDAEEADAEATGAAGALRALIAEPQRDRILDRGRRDAAFGPQLTQLTHPGVGGRITASDVRAERLELGDAVTRTQSELESPARHDVDDRGFFRELHGGAQGREQYRSSDPHGSSAGRDRGREHQRLRQVPILEEVVLREPNRVDAAAFSVLDQFE